MDSNGPSFESRDLAYLVRVRIAAGGADAHIGGKWGSAIEPDGGTGFQVGCDQQR
jgi:hypothetical protein